MVLTIFFLSLPYGCGGGRSADVQKISQDIGTTSSAENINALLLKSQALKSVKDEYFIGPEDLIEIDVFQVEDLRRTVRVSTEGNIGLPLIGQVMAKGLTRVQLEQRIAQGLKKYLVDPIVTIHIKEFKAHRIAVIGAVAKPEVYSVAGQKYLLDMLSMAGGLTKDAGKIAYVIRQSTADNKGKAKSQTIADTIAIDLEELLEKNNTVLNIPVFSGDVINVSKAGSVYIDGAIARPGIYNISRKTTIVQIIAVAGGVSFHADKSDIKIYRDNNKGGRDIVTADYNLIKDGKQEDPRIMDNDIILVGTSGFKYFLSLIGGAVGFGGSTVSITGGK
ncbi:MAG: polysaccharide export protein [Nitrospirae bacterium]|nr:polysaccharide export protein [Nitrospirota bacterium]